MDYIFKKLAQWLLQPIIRKRITRADTYVYNGITLFIPAGVFHPKYFFSTKYLLEQLLMLDLKEKLFLELGAGNGLISLSAAKAGAKVISSDINNKAIAALIDNAKTNQLEVQPYISDLFDAIPELSFDIIAINPPYYPKKPRNDFEQAWYCGEDYEYFRRLFPQLKHRISTDTKVFMVLSDTCDIETIKNICTAAGLKFELYHQKKIWWEMEYIYKISTASI